MIQFFVGLYHPADAGRFERCMVSINVLNNRKSDFHPNDWILDSGAFREIEDYGRFRFGFGVEEYAEQVERWSRCGRMKATVPQDFMCEPHILAITGLTVEEQQRLTIERYDALRRLLPARIT